MEEGWWTWADVDPQWVDHTGITPGTPVEPFETWFYSVLTPEGNVLVLYVQAISAGSIDVEWRLYKRQAVDVTTVFPDIGGRVGATKTFSFTTDGTAGPSARTETWTCEASTTMKDGMTMSTAIRRDTDPVSADVERMYIDYNGFGDLVINGFDYLDGVNDEYCVYNPPVLVSPPMASVGQMFYTMVTEDVYDSAGVWQGSILVDVWSEIYGVGTVTAADGVTTYEDCLVMWVYYSEMDESVDEYMYFAPGVGLVLVDRWSDDLVSGAWEWDVGVVEP
jgi:hypothetical protein